MGMTTASRDGATIVCPHGCPEGRRETDAANPCLTACPNCGTMRVYSHWQTDEPQGLDAEDRPAGDWKPLKRQGHAITKDTPGYHGAFDPSSWPTGRSTSTASGLAFEVQVVLGLLFLMGVLAAITYWLIQGVA